MNLSDKQIEAIRHSTKRINIFCGAVRSGKTYSSILKFIERLKNGAWGDVLICGFSRDTIQRNVINQLADIISIKVPASRCNEMQILGRNIYLIGAGNEGAIARIQGSTIALAYVDEATKLPEPFWNMLLSRLSIQGSQLIATCNPESPFSWLKRNFIDRSDELDLYHIKFELDDNRALSEDYKNNLKKEYKGVWYSRYIKGEWTLADGLVFDAFDEDNKYEHEQYPCSYRIAGVDYGTMNPTAACLLACQPNQWPQVRVEDIFYFSGRESARGKTDAEIAEDLQKWLLPYQPQLIYLDPSAASLKLELRRRGMPIKDAVNDVVPGVKIVNKFFGNKNLLVKKSCKKLLEEIGTYSWDSKAAEKGVDAVVKKNDHLCFIAGTKIACRDGFKNIEDVKLGDRVLTRMGFKRVICTMRGESEDLFWGGSYLWHSESNGEFIYKNQLIGTGDHPIITVDGKVKLRDLNHSHILFMIEEDYDIGKYTTNFSCEEFPGVHEVFNLEVEDEHEYFANGILVSNCDALRYAVASHFKTGSFEQIDSDQSINAIRKRAYGHSSENYFFDSQGYM